jgi:aspartate/methionine/tyrosine aminotransferase
VGRTVADRAGIAPFYVMEVMRAAAEREAAGGGVLHLEVGQPSTGAPAGAVVAAQRALRSGAALGYTEALGLPELRSAIAAHYRQAHRLEVDAARVVVTTGASASCVLAFLACFEMGDRVAVASPGYPCYRNILAALGVQVIDVAVDASTRFQPTPDQLEGCTPLSGVVVASPSNPTGTMLDAAALADLAAWCRDHDAWLVSDEIYHGITYRDPAVSAIGHDDGAVVVQSFSKYFSMTGWRLGWLVVPPDLIAPVERLAQNLYISPPTLAQVAGVAAFSCHDELQRNVARYATNRDILLHGLPQAGLAELAPADGAFYVWARVDHLTDDSQDLCRRWLQDLGVAATPGIDFDRSRGGKYVRFSFAGATADMVEAVRRLQAWSG